MTFGSRLVAARAAKRLTQEDLSALTGISRQSINAYERGKSVPRLATCMKLASALDVSYEFLTSDDEITDDSDSAALPAGSLYTGEISRSHSQILLDAAKAYFNSATITQDEKTSFFESVMELYLNAKREAKRAAQRKQDAD